uniref:Uncharacterized protein n=1 Tax=Arundo donax TaxID=35708 RepID=A0A0A9F6X5_ARUDO
MHSNTKQLNIELLPFRKKNQAPLEFFVVSWSMYICILQTAFDMVYGLG